MLSPQGLVSSTSQRVTAWHLLSGQEETHVRFCRWPNLVHPEEQDLQDS